MTSILQMIVVLVLIVIGTVTAGNLERVRREPEVQAYGLPKRFLKSSNSGGIEMIHLGTQLKVLSEEVNKSSDDIIDGVDSLSRVRSRPFIHTRRHQMSPGHSGNVDGYLERASLPSDDSSIIVTRRQRSIDNDDSNNGDSDNDGTQLDDLEEAEAKIFRPLFVYRKQMAERHAAKRSKNPIYGAYQYGPTIKKKNHVQSDDFKSSREYN